MPKEGKQLLVVLDNLEQFSEKLMNIMTDESPEGKAKLITVMQTALEHYNKPIENWVTGWIYSYSRKRGTEVKSKISDAEKPTDAAERLTGFKQLIEKGEWNLKSSFNYYLFVELINSVPGYEPIEESLIPKVGERLKKMLNERIDQFIEQFIAKQQAMEKAKREFEEICRLQQKALASTSIYSTLEEAKKAALADHDKVVFCLRQDNSQWKLTLIDFKGEAYSLHLGNDLAATLSEHKPDELEHENAFKLGCLSARKLFLKRTSLHINPTEDMKDICSSFILKFDEDQCSLVWMNAFGKSQDIDLAKNPELKAWLLSHPTLNPEEDVYQLKTHLLHVNVNQPIGKEEFKHELMAKLARGPAQKAPAKAVVKAKAEAAPEKKINKLNLSSFAHINEVLGRGRTKEEEHSKEESLSPTLSPRFEGPKVPVVTSKAPSSPPRRLRVENYAIAALFGHKQATKPAAVDDQSTLANNR